MRRTRARCERSWILLLTLSALSVARAQSAAPVLMFTTAPAGPNQGWEGSTTRGAAITVWAHNIGSTRGGSFVTVAGVSLTSDTDYAEWGATTNPRTAKGLQRITFWLNSNMAVGDASGMSITVNGQVSNTLPFTINNGGMIRFVDGANGNDSWDGLYRDHSLGGNHGPWRLPFTVLARPGTGPGMFLYMRGGTYTAIYNGSDPLRANIGYFETGSTQACTIYNPQINGTEALRYTVTSYPGEMATLSGVRIDIKSNYWTLTNFHMTNTAVALVLGDEWSMCTTCYLRQTGLQVIGMQFDGTMYNVINKFGDNIGIVANYIDTIPVDDPTSGFHAFTAYPLYLGAGDNLLVKDNEFHGGGMYTIHNYDESRCPGSGDINRHMNNQTFDANWFDLTRNATNPQNMRAGILTGINQPGNAYNNTVISNNVFFSRDNLVSESAIKLFSEWNTTLNGVYIYNNTLAFPNVPYGIFVWYNPSAHWQNVEVKNNIFNGNTSSEIYVDGGSATDIHPIFQNNLAAQTPRINVTGTVSGNIIGAPAFVDPLADFHLTPGSPAINAGMAIAGLTADYDDTPRPQGPAFDIGAFEYAGGSVSTVRVSVTPPAASLGQGQASQFTALVSGAANTAVNWSLNPNVGTVSGSGLYTAPGTITTAQGVQVTATSVADPTKSATATVTLTPPARRFR